MINPRITSPMTSKLKIKFLARFFSIYSVFSHFYINSSARQKETRELVMFKWKFHEKKWRKRKFPGILSRRKLHVRNFREICELRNRAFNSLPTRCIFFLSEQRLILEITCKQEWNRSRSAYYRALIINSASSRNVRREYFQFFFWRFLISIHHSVLFVNCKKRFIFLSLLDENASR